MGRCLSKDWHKKSVRLEKSGLALFLCLERIKTCSVDKEVSTLKVFDSIRKGSVVRIKPEDKRLNILVIQSHLSGVVRASLPVRKSH